MTKAPGIPAAPSPSIANGKPRIERGVCPIAKLHKAPYNPRSISADAKRGLAESINRFGLVQEIVVNRRNHRVISGHQRLDILLERGETDVPVVYVDLPEPDEKALNVALNNPHIAGDFTEALQAILDEIRTSLPEAFTPLALDKLIADLKLAGGNTDPDDAPSVPEKATTKTGDVWEMGDSLLVCGDSSNASTYAKLIDGDPIDLVFTDPPYGIDYGKKNRFLNSFQKAGRNLKDIANDMLGKDELFDMLVGAFTAARECSSDHCSYYVTAPQGGELGLMMMMMMMMRSGLPTRHVLIWNKDSQNFSLGRLDYEYKHEPILYAWNKTHRYYGGGPYRNSVWDIPKPKSSKEHPTMKPVALVENAILNSSKRGDVVLDMFAGSGTTAIAAERTQRKARLIEIDPAYCDVIVKRWEAFTGRKAKRLKSLTV